MTLTAAGTAVPRVLPPTPSPARHGRPDRRPSSHRRDTGHTGTYRADIDGLRAVAIILVVAFHAGVPFVPGGFVGVDVFFVVSGFLITGLLVDELDRTGAISLSGFYARRIRRLLPLSALVLVTTAFASAAILAPLSYESVADDIRSAALWVSNWHFAADSTQYMATTDRSPVLHYWSLSLEEQFYVFWPLIIVAVVRSARRWGPLARRRLSTSLAVVLGLSLLASVLTTTSAGPWAYFGLQTRAWELAVGAALALGIRRLRMMPLAVAGLVGWIGLGLILYAAVTITGDTPYPGIAATIPVTGAALVLVSGVRTRGLGVAALLSRPSATYVGRISYGWYLWHWPLLVFAAALAPAALNNSDGDGSTTAPTAYVVLAVVLSFGLAALSHRLIENPIRRSTWLTAYRARSLALGVVLTFVSLLGAQAWLGSGDPGASGQIGVLAPPITGSAPTPAAPDGANGSQVVAAVAPVATMTPAQASADAWPATDCFVGFTGTDAPAGCTYGVRGGSKVIALIGDSHAAQWLPALDKVAKSRGWEVHFWAKSACPMTDVSVRLQAYRTAYDACSSWRANVMRRLAALPRLDLVVVTRSSGYEQQSLVLDTGGGDADPTTAAALWGAGTRRMLTALKAITPRVVLVRDTPPADYNVPDCLSKHTSDVTACSFALASNEHLDQTFVDAESAASKGVSGVRIVDPTRLVCSTATCEVVTATGIVMYRDVGHLTRTFSASLATAFGRLLDPSLRS